MIPIPSITLKHPKWKSPTPATETPNHEKRAGIHRELSHLTTIPIFRRERRSWICFRELVLHHSSSTRNRELARNTLNTRLTPIIRNQSQSQQEGGTEATGTSPERTFHMKWRGKGPSMRSDIERCRQRFQTNTCLSRKSSIMHLPSLKTTWPPQ